MKTLTEHANEILEFIVGGLILAAAVFGVAWLFIELVAPK